MNYKQRKGRMNIMIDDINLNDNYNDNLKELFNNKMY